VQHDERKLVPPVALTVGLSLSDMPVDSVPPPVLDLDVGLRQSLDDIF